ncbi:MCP domain-containing signal transducer [Haloferax elongans ATCC BAA-1513]|uniref:MCP domain-containing signal transducer n=1 Tax=Haloferax elongans ATCC BAA-1513 TaxID=1230453 RepID=M0HEN9_HALEO|nr:methyl-accepting chemotaxis protein [Haloferax elongans]ELZ82965.1 MCP domain-containing signal transducer [Haloferax elongans ATCC BAA-1513]
MQRSRQLDRLLPSTVRDSFLRKLALGFAVTVLVVAVAGGVTYLTVSDELTENRQAELKATAGQQAEQTQSWFRERAQSARMLSQYEILWNGDHDEISQFFTKERSKLPDDVHAIHFVNTETNTVVASSSKVRRGGSAIPNDVDFVTGSLTVGDHDPTATTEVYERPGTKLVSFVSAVPGLADRAIVVEADITGLTQSFETPAEGSFTSLVSTNGAVEAGTGSLAGDDYPASEFEILAAAFEGNRGVKTVAANSVIDERHLVAYAPAGDHMAVLVHVPTASAYSLGRTVGLLVAALVFVSVVTLAGLGAVVNANTAKPLEQLSGRVDRLRDGDLDVDLPTWRTDELGAVVAGIDQLRTDLAEQRADAEDYGERISRAADGDLSVRLPTDSTSQDMRVVAESYNEMMEAVESTVDSVAEFGTEVTARSNDVAQATAEVRDAADQVARSVEQISSGAEEQTDNLVALSGEMDELSASVEQVAASAGDLAALSAETADRTETGIDAASAALDGMDDIRDETAKTVEEVEALDERLAEIESISDVISGLAEQTNILALNASIEAARAGEAGEGFAVVSEEVKQLAEESQEYAATIAELVSDLQDQRAVVVERIDQMRERVTDESEAVEEAISSLDGVVDRVEETHHSVAEIDNATDQQAETTQEVLGMADEVASIGEETTSEAESVSAAVEEQAARLQEVAGVATDLVESAADLDDALAQFDVDASVGGAELDASVGDSELDASVGETERSITDETEEPVDAPPAADD